MGKTNKASRIEQYRAMISGVQTNVGAKATIAIRGAATTQSGIVNALQGYIDAADAAATALAAYKEAIANQKTALATANGVYLGVKAYAQVQYGNQPTLLGEFGLAVPTRKEPTAATKATAVELRKATREARGTKGKVQKEPIHGTLPGTTPPAPSSPPATTTKS